MCGLCAAALNVAYEHLVQVSEEGAETVKKHASNLFEDSGAFMTQRRNMRRAPLVRCAFTHRGPAFQAVLAFNQR